MSNYCLEKKVLKLRKSKKLRIFIFDYDVIYDANEGENPPVNEETYNVGDEITVLGIGDMTKDGFEFVEWNTEVDGEGTSYDPDDTFTMPAADVTLSAQWDAIDYTVSLTTDPEEGGTVTGNGTYNFGVSVTIEAIANPGWEFVNWTDDDDVDAVVNTDTEYNFDMPAKDVNYTANFELVGPFVINVTTIQDGGAASYTLIDRDKDDFTKIYSNYSA